MQINQSYQFWARSFHGSSLLKREKVLNEISAKNTSDFFYCAETKFVEA